jgi:hypothetical protein
MKYNKTWADLNRPIEDSRIGRMFQRMFLKLCIWQTEFDIAIAQVGGNRGHIADLKSDLLEFRGHLHRLEIQ